MNIMNRYVVFTAFTLNGFLYYENFVKNRNANYEKKIEKRKKKKISALGWCWG